MDSFSYAHTNTYTYSYIRGERDIVHTQTSRGSLCMCMYTYSNRHLCIIYKHIWLGEGENVYLLLCYI